MFGVWVWWRRCSAARLFPALVAVVLVEVSSRPYLDFELAWAMSWGAGSAVVLSWVGAGVVAFDQSRRVAPTLAELASTAPRNLAGVGALAVASWVWLCAAWGVGVGYALARALAKGAGGPPELWGLVEAPVLLAVGACVGLLVGTLLPNLAAGPLAIAVMFCGYAAPVVPHGLMQAAGALGPFLELEVTPAWSLGSMVAHLALAVSAWMVAAAATSRWQPRMVRLVGASLVVLVGALLVFGEVSSRTEVYRNASAATVCLGATPTVCGPDRARWYLEDSQQRLAGAVTRLQGSGLRFADRYYLVREVEDIPRRADAGQLSFGDALMTAWDLTATLSNPRFCKATYAGEQDLGLEETRAQVMGWVNEQVVGRTSSGEPVTVGAPAPDDVKKAFAVISECEPMHS